MIRPSGIVALVTDYGLRDHYAGVLKGAILSANPKARIVDVTHDVPPQDVSEAGRILTAAVPYFPPGTVFVAVVDPGVGTDRAILGVETERQFLLAPDNGLLAHLNRNGGEFRRLVAIRESKYFRKPVSRTFHGRDIFAPVAGLLSAGVPLLRFGPEVRQLEEDGRAPRLKPGLIEGEVAAVDRFGNVITNIPEGLLPDADDICIRIGRKTLRRLSGTYADARKGALLALVGSTGHLEISVNQGHASKAARIQKGDRVLVTRARR